MATCMGRMVITIERAIADDDCAAVPWRRLAYAPGDTENVTLPPRWLTRTRTQLTNG